MVASRVAVVGVPVLLAFAGSAALFGAPARQGPGRETADERVVLDRRSADYREDEDPSRVVAALEAVLARNGSRAHLSIGAAAKGLRVVAPPGAAGLCGGNEICARELESLVATGRVVVRVTGPAGETSEGRAVAGRRDTILVRRISKDGRVDHVPIGGRPRLVETRFEAKLDGFGGHTVDLVVDGRVRARARCEVTGAGGRILFLGGVSETGAEVRP